MSTKNEINFTVTFADETTKEYTFGPYDGSSTTLANAATNIKALNTKVADWGGKLVSDGGAAATGITSASVVTTSEQTINLNDD